MIAQQLNFSRSPSAFDMQIRTKLTLQFFLLVASILLLSSFFIYYQFCQTTESAFYANLRSKALITAEMMVGEAPPNTPASSNFTTKELPFQDNIVIYDAALQRVFTFDKDADPLSEKARASLLSGQEEHFQNKGLLAVSLPYKNSKGQLYIVVVESVFDATVLHNLLYALVINFFLSIGIVALFGRLYAGQALDPVKRIVGQVAGIRPADLSARLQSRNNHDEIAHLVETFNHLLERIQVAFRLQKSFISNVSHELKNPLSVIIAQLEIALHKPERTPEEYRATLYSILDDTRELNAISEKLLQLARLHSEDNTIRFTAVRLDEALLQTRALLLRLHPDYHITFDIDGEPAHEDDLTIVGNEPLLRTAFLNLMDNGCKFSENKTVAVRVVFMPNKTYRVEISDQGPGIPEVDLAQIFEPFFRSPQSRHIRGSGIGLSLVDSIMKLHHVHFEVQSVLGSGTTFQMQFAAE